MSREIYSLLLQQKMNDFKTENKKKKYLINCIDQHGAYKGADQKILSQVVQNFNDICVACKSSSFVFTSHEKICNECGVTTQYTKPKFDPMSSNLGGSFIQPGTLMVPITKNGKKVMVDLSTISSWLDVPPEEQNLVRTSKEIMDVLDNIRNPNGTPLQDSIVREIMAIWYNIIQYDPDIKGVQRKSLQVLSVYYGLTHNNFKISLQKIAAMFGVNSGDVFSNNALIKKIFNNTGYEKYITLKIGEFCKVEIDPSIKGRLEIMKLDLAKYLHTPLTVKEYTGMIYYINKQLKNRDVTLRSLAENCTLSENTIRNSSSTYEIFYKNNNNLYKRLFP